MCIIILHIFQEEFRSLIAYRYRAKVKFGKNSFFLLRNSKKKKKSHSPEAYLLARCSRVDTIRTRAENWDSDLPDPNHEANTAVPATSQPDTEPLLPLLLFSLPLPPFLLRSQTTRPGPNSSLFPLFLFFFWNNFFRVLVFFFFFRTSLLVASSTFHLIFTLFHPFPLVLLWYISFPLYYSLFLIYLFLLFFYLFSRTKIPPGVIACLCHISVPLFPFY